MKIRRTFLALGLVAGVVALPVFGTSGAIVNPMAGTVAVNGQPVVAGSAVVAGDLVSTSAQGSANLVLPGGSVIAASNTNFRLVSVNHATQLKLNSGLVKVSGNLPVALNTRTIVPATAKANFNVYDLSGKVYVEAVSGNVNVTSGTSSYTVHSGEAVTFADAQAPAAASASAGAGATLAVPAAIGIAAAAAVVTGIVVHQVTKCSNCTSSPSQE